MTTVHRPASFAEQLDDELELACRAVLLVSTGTTPRVIVANLRHGRHILEPARAFGADYDVAVSTLATQRSDRVDLVVEPAAGESAPAPAARPARIPATTRSRPQRHATDPVSAGS